VRRYFRRTQRAEPRFITHELVSIGKRLFNWRTVVPLLIVIVAFVFLAQKAGINPQQIWATIRTTNLIFLLAAFLMHYLSLPLRTLRWRIFLENVGFTKANGVELPKFWRLTEIIYISWFLNAIVPAKLGDLYRAYLVRQETGCSATRSFGTVLAERLLDLIILLLLFIAAVMISLHKKLPHQLQLGLIIILALVFISLIGLFVLRLLCERIAKLVPVRFLDQYNHFQEGILSSFRRIPTLTVLTVGVWVCESLRFFFVALALNLIGGDLLHLVAAAFFVGLGEALLNAIPLTGGGVGPIEAGMIGMIALFNSSTLTTHKSLAAAAIVIDRTITLLSILVIGSIVFIFALGRSTRKQSNQNKPGVPDRVPKTHLDHLGAVSHQVSQFPNGESDRVYEKIVERVQEH
jgi:glycosyltransferase 2 family protein